MNQQLHFQIRETSGVAEARREVTGLARAIGFDESVIGRVALVVTEAASNLVKHTPEGQFLARAFDRDGVAAIEVLALDQGPGMANTGESLRDGYSTAGSQGTGLGAISDSRTSSTFIRFRAKEPRSSRNCGREGRRAETVRRRLRSAPFVCPSSARWRAVTPGRSSGEAVTASF